MPGWQYGLIESITRTQSKLVPRLARKHLRPDFIASNRTKTWWVEFSPQAPELGESVYAADANGQVIAGYQCLAAEVCIAWERLGQ